MPPLKKMIRPGSETLSGFAAVEAPKGPPPVMSEPLRTTGSNSYIRCPIPPLNVGPDTLRQFNENGKTPTRRVIPLPVSTVVGSGTTINKTTVITTGGSSGGGSSTPKLVTAQTTVSVPPLAVGQRFVITSTMAKSFQLLKLSSSIPVEVRLYADSLTQGGDIARTPDSAVPFEIVPGLITDVVFDTPPYVWSWQNRIAANADSPQTTNIYITVVNSSSVPTTAGTITLVYLPLES